MKEKGKIIEACRFPAQRLQGTASGSRDENHTQASPCLKNNGRARNGSHDSENVLI